MLSNYTSLNPFLQVKSIKRKKIVEVMQAVEELVLIPFYKSNQSNNGTKAFLKCDEDKKSLNPFLQVKSIKLWLKEVT